MQWLVPAEAYGLAGAVLGASITLVTTWLGQRNQRELETEKIREARKQLLFKEKSEKVHQLAVDLSATAYLFLWVTWSAEYDDLDQKMLQKYWDQISALMPRLYADQVLIAGLDKELDKLAASFVDEADKLDESIGKATLSLRKPENILLLRKLHADAEAFANAITRGLSASIEKIRSVDWCSGGNSSVARIERQRNRASLPAHQSLPDIGIPDCASFKRGYGSDVQRIKRCLDLIETFLDSELR
jgi:hypothetical protein